MKSNPPTITSKAIYPMRYGNYSLSLVWTAPENSERIHIYSYHVQWTIIPRKTNSKSKNYYNNSVFIESHDIALRRHVYDEVSRHPVLLYYSSFLKYHFLQVMINITKNDILKSL